MRKAVSFLLVLVFISSSSTLVFPQKMRPGRVRSDVDREAQSNKDNKPAKVEKPARETKFSVAEAYTKGEGVWVHWQMEAEDNNLGFYVYRIDGGGERIVSEFVMGSTFKTGEQSLYGQNYTFFDPSGTAESRYYVETQGTTQKEFIRSRMFVPEVVRSYPKADGVTMFGATPTVNEAARPTTTVIDLPSDLKAEVEASQAAADLNRHREIIAMPGARIAAKNDGIIRVTKAQLQNAGFDVNSDPNLWQLYLEGVERPIIIGPNADYIEFFGKTLDTVESDIRTYYLVVGSQPGKRVRSVWTRPGTSSFASRRYYQSTTKKERTNYIYQIINGDSENYWGRVVAYLPPLNGDPWGNVTSFNFNLSGIDQTDANRTLKVQFQGYTFTAHSVEILLNGNALAPTTGSNRQPFSLEYSIPVSYLVEGNNSIKMRSTNAGDISLFDSVSIDFPRTYKAQNNRLDFYTTNYRKAIVSGFSTPNVRVFDVTNPDDPANIDGLQIAETNGTYGPIMPALRGRVLYATEASNFSTPISVLANNPEMLGVPTQGAQFVVISHSSLLTQAQTWAAYRAGQGFSTKVIDVDDIFDEFNYGVSSSQAIKDFLNYAEYNWQISPQYVLLMGDASTNPKNYPDQSGFQPGYWNMVPTRQVNTIYLETGSDEALADFNNDGLAEIPIGRIAARTPAEVTTIFNKTVTWENSLSATSLNRGAFFAFDYPDGYDFHAMSDRLMSNLPGTMPTTTVQSNDAGSQTFAVNAINTGKFVVNYTGHGTSGAWRNSAFFDKSDVPSLTNSGLPPAGLPSLFVSLTCLNAYFISPREDANPDLDSTSLAEKLLRASNGGAAAVWASTGETTPDVQEVMGTRFFTRLGDNSNLVRLGDLINDAKAQVVGGTDVRLSWALLGDPMLKVKAQ